MTTPRKWLLVGALALATLVLGPALGLPAQAASPASVSGADAVAKAASAGKPVRVIATLDIPSGPQGRVSAPSAAHAVQALRTRLASSGVGKIDPIVGTPFVVLEVDASQLQALVASGLVTTVQEDAVRQPQLAQSVPLVDAPAAWAAGARGAGWAVAILDTGVQANHPFLAGRVVQEACFSSTTSAATTACPNGQDSQTGAGAAAPCSSNSCFHGTHVAGIAAGRAYAGGPSYSGVAPDADIIAVQIFSNFSTGCGSATPPCTLAYTSDIVRGLQYVLGLTSTRKIASANMSLGGGSYTAACDSDLTKSSIDQLLAAGVATVISAGNEGFTNAVGSPGCVSTAVTVGATYDTGSQGVTSYSNSAPMLDLLAPGSTITSSLPGSTFGDLQGTSMAAPHVTGAYAVLRSASPASGPGAIEQALETTGKPILDARNNLTRPRIDVDAACVKLGACAAPPAQPGWQAWASRGGPIDTGAFCATVGGGAQCWARTPGSFHLLWFRSADGNSWQAPVDLGGSFGPGGVWCLVRGARIDCSGVNTAGHLATLTTTDGVSWGAVQDHGGAVMDRPSCLAPLGDAVAYECYAIGVDDVLYRFAYDGTKWAAAKKIAGATSFARPDCYVRSSAAECFVADDTANLKLVRVTKGVAGSFAKIATRFKAAPHCLPSGGVVDCFGQNAAKHLAKGYYDGKKWAAFADLGGNPTTPPYCDRDGANFDCFYLNAAGHLIQRQRKGQTWQPELDIAALPANSPVTLLQQRPYCPSRNGGARIDCFGRGASDSQLWQKTFQ